MTVANVTYNNPTSATILVNVAAGASLGARDMTLTNPDGQSVIATGGFTVLPGLAGDINGDGFVNVGDLQLLVAAWGNHAGPPASCYWNPNADCNNDGFINVGDLQILVAH